MSTEFDIIIFRQIRVYESRFCTVNFCDLSLVSRLGARVLDYGAAGSGMQNVNDCGGELNHFSITEWTDYTRKVATEEQCALMLAHLTEGCSSCTKAAQTWESFTEFANQELLYEPPASSLRIAKSYFVPLNSAAKLATGMQLGRLTFDSFAAALQRGVRGGNMLSRQLMYECNDVLIDLRLEPKTGPRQVALVGQVANSRQSEESAEGVPVILLSNGEQLSHTSTNQFGEFQLSYRSSPGLQVVIHVKETAVVLSLPDAVGESAFH